MEDGIRDLEGSSGPNIQREPKYVAAARRLKPETEDLGTFLARHTGKVSSATFPGPDCLHPDELWDLRHGIELPQDRIDHLATCDACSAMVEATKPSEERLQGFRDAVAARNRIAVTEARKTGWARRWAPALAAGLLVAAGGTVALVESPFGPLVAKRGPLDKPGTTAVLPEARVVVTAEMSAPKSEGQVFVRTAPITVTASVANAATVAAATAAVLTHFDVVQTEAKTADSAEPGVINSCSAVPDKCQELAKSFAGLLTDYLGAEKANGSTNVSVSRWFEEYQKTHPEQVQALLSVSKVGDTDSPALGGTNKGLESATAQWAEDVKIARIVPTLKTASVFYSQAPEKLKGLDPIVGDVDVDWKVKDVTLKVKLTNSSTAADETKKTRLFLAGPEQTKK